ncbi:MAG: 4-alpha-glucanotransferase [Gammaproteobacteria bacterium]|nr:4-alpha-glucanotransferase [Gammaproteobacteria bacterium]NIR85266.1 4-alpha-glucanotransferase [Gammaproteobacteria bacterium]NIR88382.1 4-alpha-glucanotransferase [Gammaproteobacteria bacterium]NIU06332.1 4-alpha-glucanotransferase [Gammaproteobacteria bacterium]NIV53231.1 4-alpha-glucanotransferase [Gammaproteobacteria bacterium]
MPSPHARRTSCPVLDRRRAGILLHPTSLPGPREGGELGREARRFVDFLVDVGASVWQMLPLGPPHEDLSPYAVQSAHAGNPRLIALDDLAAWGWVEHVPEGEAVDRGSCLGAAMQGFVEVAGEETRAEFQRFVRENAAWLEDYILFQALREAHGLAPWWEWPALLRDRESGALARAREQHAETLARHRFEQFVFHRQWRALRSYANERGVLLFGDMPIFTAHDSADVWAAREYFRLDDEGRPVVVAGTPPDYFSATGQFWGNPLYDWARLRADDYRWWRERVATQLQFFDLLRVDHFRGFEACWEIPAGAESATEGRWVKAPGEELFAVLQRELDPLPLVAEDLGYITEEVHALRVRFGLPGMRILQFAFDGGADNPYLPHNHVPDCVVYTGTHDNDTSLGWFQSLAPEARKYVCAYLAVSGRDMPAAFVRTAFASVARLAVVPMQDVLGLGSEHRLNTPGVAGGNWSWRFSWDQMPAGTRDWLRRLLALYGRTTPKNQCQR